mmetsp:Transcript_16006/g.48441  ORF Transcript_16006/g.48441 Transcript_16006/m.48441 type:complete len:203 (-) Transcript_16006:412-1020(-)
MRRLLRRRGATSSRRAKKGRKRRCVFVVVLSFARHDTTHARRRRRRRRWLLYAATCLLGDDGVDVGGGAVDVADVVERARADAARGRLTRRDVLLVAALGRSSLFFRASCGGPRGVDFVQQSRRRRARGVGFRVADVVGFARVGAVGARGDRRQREADVLLARALFAAQLDVALPRKVAAEVRQKARVLRRRRHAVPALRQS